MTIKQPSLLFLFLALLCIFAAASPPTPRENIPVNSEVFVQPEYIEALDKELEREDPIYGGSWWIHYQEEQRKKHEARKYSPSSWQHGNLDHIGGGNLLRRNLDPIGGGNLLRRNLDQIGGGNLVKRYVPDANFLPDTFESRDGIGAGLIFRRFFNDQLKTESSSSPLKSRPGGSLHPTGDGFLIKLID